MELKRSWGRIGAVLLLALGLRVLFLALAGVNAPLTGDELAYQQIAEHIAGGQGFFQTNNPFFPGEVLYAWQAPLYPLSIGILYTLFGSNILLAKLFGVLVSTATVYVVYDLTRRVFRGGGGQEVATLHERTALAAALLVAIYPGLVTQAHLLLSETLFIFFLLLAFDLLAHALTTRRRVWVWIGAAGVSWGLATLTRGITLYFTPLLALWVGWMLWKRGQGDEAQRGGAHPSKQGDHKGAPLRLGIVHAGIGAVLFVIAVIVVMIPWAARNYTQFDQVVLVETKGGVNLWLGNSPYTPDEFIRNVWKVGVREPMLNALPAPVSAGDAEVERDRAAYALGMNFMRAEPVTFLRRIAPKFADFWGFERNLIDNAEATVSGDGWNSPLKVAADLYGAVGYVVVMLLGLAGLVFAPWNGWKILLVGFLLFFLAIHLVIFGDGRFHLPLIPLFCMFGAWFVVRWREVRWTVPHAAALALLVLLLVGVWVREAAVALAVLGNG